MCNTCLERHHATVMIKLPCEHRFCAECLKGLFLRSIKDETLFPPRCCQQGIPLSLVKKHMSSHEIEAFEDASIEFTTIDKTYCSNGACNKFIPPTTGTIFPNTARCKSCAALTCTMCKGGYHHDSECPKDESVEQTKVLARELGWQECPRCRSFVELRSGCYHMTCRCKAEFCYLCGVTWPGCNCVRADEGRIEERAAEIVDRDAEHVIAPARRARMINQVRDHLLEHHECTHSRHFERITTFRRRGYQCEICDARHWNYILQCRRCYMNVCEDCRRHRV
ncbi:uncharacterized protein K489DRAFT_342636 [Dissoconium aciculare CBS 342.82]|uniref:RBR-type E3 ubiquitin transferase n=1 Tax=Dissoconium aciculare CBS 342.82 TaxID=1314786 RepID=A0A6J3LZK9_9PEZI|nr:uncharacterized protein K489DRAFT_342636 [Dissoconium aciculare CBS 342.82]KAF1820694.1 hypothetical protein K489DRAFT_342636 [Dissoconium aciculare CBS 342.82]